MKQNDLIIKVWGDINKFISKCLNYNITLLNITYLDKDNILVKIKKNDYERIKKIGYFCKINKYKYLGIDALKIFIKRNKLVLITIFFCFVLMYFIEGFIVNIDIIHSNKEIINLVEKELNNKGIKPFMYKKSFDELNEIKNQIVEENPEKIEWMSITRKGMKYIVRVEERILTDIKKESGYCHVVAKKAGIIKKIISSKGEIIPRIDDYVKEGDLLINGEIKLFEETKDNTCANGIVMAEVWYKVNLSIPLTHLEKEYTGNSRYNFIINNKKLFKEKYKLYDEEEINKIKVRDFRIKYIKEKEYKQFLVKYSENDALKKALEDVEEKMKVKLGKKGEIISKKVLKKSLFDSKMEVEVFVVALEDIATVVNYEPKVGEESDTE